MTKISVHVESDQGRYHPGTAIVRLDGEIVAKLRGDEGIEFEVKAPEVTLELQLPPFPLDEEATARAVEILDRRLPTGDWCDPDFDCDRRGGPHDCMCPPEQPSRSEPLSPRDREQIGTHTGRQPRGA